MADEVEALTDPDLMFAELAGQLANPLDPVLSDSTRLRIQAALHALPTNTAMSFTILRKALALTDGNLGTHLHVLVDAGFVGTQEQWRGKRRTTLYRATSAGRAAFEAHAECHHRGLGALSRGWPARPGRPPNRPDRARIPSVVTAADHGDEGIAQSRHDSHDGVRNAASVQQRHDRERRAGRHGDGGIGYR
jgi:DNA-binding MarR family transcriptional regulator